jgi:hypothetical protein
MCFFWTGNRIAIRSIGGDGPRICAFVARCECLGLAPVAYRFCVASADTDRSTPHTGPSGPGYDIGAYPWNSCPFSFGRAVTSGQRAWNGPAGGRRNCVGRTDRGCGSLFVGRSYVILIPLPSGLRPLGTLMKSLLRRTGRATTWLPWLGVALVIAAVLSPGTVTASLLAFQSSPPPTPVPPTPTPVPPPPTSTPVPPSPPTSTPVQPTPVPPTQAPPQPTPTQVQPIQPVPSPSLTPTMPPTPVMLPVPTPTLLPPLPPPTLQPVSGSNQPIVNWVKFWDTIAVTLAYPWLCCGVALLLLVPVILLLLEIKGRRAPPRPPEPAPEWKGDEE